MLSSRRITKSFGELKVLKNVSVDVKQGEIVSIVGPSGAGKSTLLQILGTLDKPDSGEVFFEDQSIHKLSSAGVSAFRNKAIGFVFQFHNLLPEFTALENVCIPGYIGNRNRKEVKRKAINLLDTLGLSDRIDHKPEQLSGGEQQRVAVARALINDPHIILADEPSGNLDSANAKQLHELFFKLRDELNKTFIIVTHNEELANMSDRKLEMKDGELV